MDVQAVAGPSRIPYQNGHIEEDGIAGQPSVTVTVREVTIPADVEPSSIPASTAASASIQAGPSGQSSSSSLQDNDRHLHTAANPVSSAVYSTNHPALRRFRTGYCYDSRMTLHEYPSDPDNPGDTHPEVPERIIRTYEVVSSAGYLEKMQRIPVREALRNEVMLAHTEELWLRVNSLAVQPPEFYLANKGLFHNLSLYVNEYSAVCARLSLGGVIETCRAVAEGRVQNAFAIVRPPGHHAEPDSSMGFCFYNNVAVAAEYVKAVYPDIKKVLILDWDVHHGNGTQKAFWTSEDVLYMSIHLYEGGTFYPGGTYGAANMCGQGPGRGRTVNVPWEEADMGDADYLYAFQKIIMPIAYEFAPDFVIISAGFDAARGDTLGKCDVTPAGYAHMTHMLSAVAGGKLVIALEGGYNVDSVANSALECIRVLLGEAPPALPAMTASDSATMTMHLVAEEQSKYWKSIRPTFAPKEDLEEVAQLTPLSEILKSHRTSHLYHKYGMYNVTISDANLQKKFKNQLLVSDNIFDQYGKGVNTALMFVHEMLRNAFISGDVHAQLNALEGRVELENAFLVETSARVFAWASQNNWALIDVNILPRSQKIVGLDRANLANVEYALVRHVWEHIVGVALNIEHIILVGESQGCNAIVRLLNNYSETCRRRVKAAVQLFDIHPPARLATNSEVPGLRTWFYDVSMAIFPAKHIFEEDESRVGKRYGRVFIANDPRPTHVLHDQWERIRDFVESKVAPSHMPAEPLVPSTSMSIG